MALPPIRNPFKSLFPRPAPVIPVRSDQQSASALNIASTTGLTRAWQGVFKTSHQTKTSNTTLANDSQLVIPMTRVTNYRVRGQILFAAAAACDFKFTFVTPGVGTGSLRVSYGFNAAAETVQVTLPGSVGTISVLTASELRGSILIDGIILNYYTSGNFAFQWAQDTSTADLAIVYAGSYLEYTDLGFVAVE